MRVGESSLDSDLEQQVLSAIAHSDDCMLGPLFQNVPSCPVHKRGNPVCAGGFRSEQEQERQPRGHRARADPGLELPRSEAVCRLPFKWKKQRLEVDMDRLDALDAAQKAELRKVIEDILRRL